MTEQAQKIPLSKAELAEVYGLHVAALKRLMNIVYLEELQKVGYVKTEKSLTPKVVRKFIECHGEPLTKNDFQINIPFNV